MKRQNTILFVLAAVCMVGCGNATATQNAMSASTESEAFSSNDSTEIITENNTELPSEESVITSVSGAVAPGTSVVIDTLEDEPVTVEMEYTVKNVQASLAAVIDVKLEDGNKQEVLPDGMISVTILRSDLADANISDSNLIYRYDEDSQQLIMCAVHYEPDAIIIDCDKVGTFVAIDSPTNSLNTIPAVVMYQASHGGSYVPSKHVSEWGSYPNVNGGYSVWVRGYYDENKEWVEIEYNESVTIEGQTYIGYPIEVWDGTAWRYDYNGTKMQLGEIIFHCYGLPLYSSKSEALNNSTKGGTQDDFDMYCAAEDYEFAMEAGNMLDDCFWQCEDDIKDQIIAGTPQ